MAYEADYISKLPITPNAWTKIVVITSQQPITVCQKQPTFLFFSYKSPITTSSFGPPPHLAIWSASQRSSLFGSPINRISSCFDRDDQERVLIVMIKKVLVYLN